MIGPGLANREAGLIQIINKTGRNSMSAHDRNLVLMMCFAAVLVSVNFFAVISGAADSYYGQLTDMLSPLLRR
jgi:hypothetical protein